MGQTQDSARRLGLVSCVKHYIVDLFMRVGVDYSARAGRTAQSQLIDSLALQGIAKK